VTKDRDFGVAATVMGDACAVDEYDVAVIDPELLEHAADNSLTGTQPFIQSSLLSHHRLRQSALRNFAVPTGRAWNVTPGFSSCRRVSFFSDGRPVCCGNFEMPPSPAAARLAPPVIRSQLL
jgi:hypothetical protein